MRVMVFGTFDHLHPGHTYVLDQAMKKKNAELFVIVGRDSNVQKIKGHTPLQSQDERMQAIKEKYPDATVLLGHESDFLARIREVQPDLILLGYDQKLPPGISESDLGTAVERLDAFEPHIYKSSLIRNGK